MQPECSDVEDSSCFRRQPYMYLVRKPHHCASVTCLPPSPSLWARTSALPDAGTDAARLSIRSSRPITCQCLALRPIEFARLPPHALLVPMAPATYSSICQLTASIVLVEQRSTLHSRHENFVRRAALHESLPRAICSLPLRSSHSALCSTLSAHSSGDISCPAVFVDTSTHSQYHRPLVPLPSHSHDNVVSASRRHRIPCG
ncbi:hypothetical protein R3P38DRAFT_3085261 [Favolaschia claudopus]|uniref:Uncharacterized protein n=1 Tax=Favolaschia claudopus TaxID=2862362 RepID=A0AAV9ZUJ2_9AGAR